MRTRTTTTAVVVATLALAGCTVTAAPSPGSVEPASAVAPAHLPLPVSTTTPAPAATPTSTRLPASPIPETKPLSGRLVVIDPGHNGVWTRRELRKVPSGNGRTKECNSSGTATNAGYPEHAYTWAQARALAAVLRARGATVLLTRQNDSGEGPCVNLRSSLANARKADALVSIHADGSFARGARGFHVIVSTRMVGGAAVEKASLGLAKSLRDALETETAMPRSTYIGAGTALSLRNDLGTLNLSARTAVMLEMGNMRNATDASLLGSTVFRAQAAKALADGLTAALR